jgi:hypothetical protein
VRSDVVHFRAHLDDFTQQADVAFNGCNAGVKVAVGKHRSSWADEAKGWTDESLRRPSVLGHTFCSSSA